MDLIYSAGNSETAKQVGLALAIFLALDMIVVLFLASLTSVFFLTIIGGLVFLIEGLIVYFSYSISKMSYRITDNELVIEFKPSKMRIPFNYISDVHQATTTLNWRLFGASLPGLHWGV